MDAGPEPTLLGRLADTLVPARCPGCGRTGTSLCGSCASTLEQAPDRPAPPHLDALVGLLRHRGVARRVVLGAKYRNDERLLALLGAALGPLLDHLLDHPADHPPGRPTVVTWVPGTPGHRRRRGGDPAATLARSAAANSVHTPIAIQLLRRLDDRAQTGRDRPARAAGPALTVTTPTGIGGTVVVVDDVCTTGASLSAAAARLRSAGAARVLGLVLAIRD